MTTETTAASIQRGDYVMALWGDTWQCGVVVRMTADTLDVADSTRIARCTRRGASHAPMVWDRANTEELAAWRHIRRRLLAGLYD